MKRKEFSKDVDFELITKYFAGECNPDEENAVKLWILADEKNKRLITSLKELWDSTGSETINIDINAAWESVSKRIDSDVEEVHSISTPSKNKRIIRPLIRRIASVAAIFLILLGGYTVLRQIGIFNKNENIETAWHERITAAGEKSIIKFSDGTRITLNGNSKLKYLTNPSNNKRQVYLEGEAFFEVTHDSSRQFIVYCNNISTTDLGTKFNISAYSNEKVIAISLVDGQVNVSENEEGSVKKVTILAPKQQYVYSTIKKTYNLKEFDVEEITGWKDNLLKFKDETLKNVFVKLERAYGVKFELIPKSFENYLITTNFQKASLTTISEAIKKLTGLDYNTVKENDQIKEIVFNKK